MHECPASAVRAQRQAQSPCRLLPPQELLEQERLLGQRGGRGARQQRRELVAHGEQARRLQPDHRHAVLDERAERRERRPCLAPRLLHEPDREKGPSAAQGPPRGRLRRVHAVAGRLEHGDGGPGVVRLEPGGEGVGEQDDVAPVAGQMHARSARGDTAWGASAAASAAR